MAIVFTMVNTYGMYLGLNKITEIGTFISAKNVLFGGLGDRYNWTLH